MTTYSIGRSDTNDITLQDKTVSRQHATLELLPDGKYRLRDLNSSQGTEVKRGNGWQRISDTTVAGNAQVRLGTLETNVGALMALVSLVHGDGRAISADRIVRAKTASDSQTTFAAKQSPYSRVGWFMVVLTAVVVLALLTALVLYLYVI